MLAPAAPLLAGSSAPKLTLMNPNDELVLRADPADAEPSEVPGLTRGEFDELADNLRWFSRVPLRAKLRAIAQHQAEARRLQAMTRREPGLKTGRGPG